MTPETRRAIDRYRANQLTLIELIECILLDEPSSAHDLVTALPSDALVGLIGWLDGEERLGDRPVLRFDGLGLRALSVGELQSRRRRTASLQRPKTRARAVLEMLDLKTAVANVKSDAFGDWFRDPWGWPETEWLAEHGSSHILARLMTAPVPEVLSFEVPKEVGVRHAVVMAPSDRLIYQACADLTSPSVNGVLGDWVFGWRPVKGELRPGRYARQDYQWQNYQYRLSKSAKLFEVGLHLDVQAFYESVKVEPLLDVLRALGVHSEPLDVIRDRVLAVGRVSGVRGLPQRSHASAILANLALVGVDDIASHAVERAARWADDYWLFDPDPAVLLSAQKQIESAFGDLGLELNLNKRQLLEGAALRLQLDRIDVGYVDAVLQRGAQSSIRDVLDGAVDGLLAIGAGVSRHEVSFVVSRIKQSYRVDLARKVADLLIRRFPDLVVPMLKRLGIWQEYADEFVGLLNVLDPWFSSVLLRVFPLQSEPLSGLMSWLVACVLDSHALPMLRVAAISRLAAWDSKVLVGLERELLRDEPDYFVKRAYALAVAQVTRKRGALRRNLLNDDRCFMLAEFIEARPLGQLGLVS